jgi:hypothetical protein
MNFLGLPEALVRAFLVEWLELKYVVRLDSAWCCRTVRRAWASLAYGQLTTFSVNFSAPFQWVNPLLRWAVAKGARLDGVCICGSVIATERSLRQLEAFLVMNGSVIRHVCSYIHSKANCVSHRDALLLVAKWCPNVVSFQGLGSDETRRKWDDPLLALAKAWPKLTKLSLNGMLLSERGLGESLRQCAVLEYLEVMTENHVIPVDAARPYLKSLKSGSRLVSDAVLIAIGQRCSKLETLRIFQFASSVGDHQVTDIGVRAVLQGCPLLRETDVEYATGISTELRVELAKRLSPRSLYLEHWMDQDETLAQEVLEVCPNLTSLSSWHSELLTDATLAVCAQHCPQLHELTLGESPGISVEGMIALVSKLGRTLRTVDLKFCQQLDDEVALALAEHCPLLELFYPPPNVSDAAVAKLRERCVNLKW